MTQSEGTTRDGLDTALLLSTQDLAALLARSIRSVQRDNSTGRLPRPLRLGGAIRWRRDEVLRWVAAGCPARREWERLEGARDR